MWKTCTNTDITKTKTTPYYYLLDIQLIKISTLTNYIERFLCLIAYVIIAIVVKKSVLRPLISHPISTLSPN